MNPEDQLAQPSVGQMNDQPPQFIRAGTTVQLPYHINPETGAGYELEVEADTPVPVFQAEVDRLFPKTLASLSTQLLDKNPEAPLLSQEDFMTVWKSAEAMDAGKTERQNQIKGGPGFWSKGYDVIREALHTLGTGAAESSATLGQVGTAIADMNPNAAASAGVKLLNGVMTGTGRLSDSAKVLGALAWDKVAGDPYGLYKAGKDAQYAEYLRKTQGFSMVPGSTPQEIEAGLQLGNVMDITVLLPMVSGIAKGMSKAGQVAAEQTIEQIGKTMAERSAESLGRRALGQVFETAGAAAEKVGSLSAIGDSFSKGFLKNAGTGVGALAAAELLPEEGMLGGVGTALRIYGGLRSAQVAGASMKWAGKILGSEELASKITQEALRDASVQGAERLAVKLVKNIPDPVVRMTRKIMDGAMIPAAIGATLSGAQEASDPFSSPLDVAQATVLGGAGGAAVGGLISGAFGLGGEVTGKAREQSFVREIMTDLATRPEQRSFVVGNQDIIVPDDIQNRLSVLNSDRMNTREKASLFGVLDSAEHAGIDVAFINDSTPLPDALGGSGANMGKGVKFVNDAGRKTVFVNSDQITHTGAIHEVMHAYIGDQVASDFVSNLTKERGGEIGAFQELSTFAQRYYDTQVQTNPEAAAQIKASIDRMNDPQVPLPDRLVAATDLAHEYMAEGISQSLSNVKPEALQDFRGSAISAAADRAFQGTLEKINKSFGMSSVGATHDPISGHFFKDGQIISSQPLADITKKVQTAIKTRTEVPVNVATVERPVVPKDVPVVGETMPSGGRVVAVEPRATYEDTHPNGALTTETEKAKYHKAVWNQTTKFMGPELAKDVIIEQGVYPGNMKEGTPIIYTDKLTPQHISGLFQVQTQHGRPLIAPENREAVARFAQALNDGNLVSVTHSVNTGKSTGKNRAYAVSVDQIGLPMAFSMSSGRRGSGPKMEFFNLSLVNDMVNLNRTSSSAIDAALKDLKVTSLDDTIPYAKAYIDNLSATGSVPSVRALAAVAPEGVKPKSLEFMRDMLHLSSGIEPREVRGEARINEPFTTSEQFLKYSNPELVAVTPTGEKFKTKLSRDRAVIQSVRLDGVTDVQLYQPNGTPVQITVNKPQLINKVRANFSPATSSREALPNGETITDGETGQRIIVSPKGKAKLFDQQGKLVGVFEDEDAAILKSNQDKLKQVQAVPKARDAAYAKAVQENNPQAAQQMVDETAKAAGYDTSDWYHGQNKSTKFNEFDPTKGDSFGGFNAFGSWFTKDKIQAEGYSKFFDKEAGALKAGNVYKTYLKLNKPLVFDSFDNLVEAFKKETGKEPSKASKDDSLSFRNSLIAKGYDSVVLPNVDKDSFPGAKENQSYAVALFPSQVKSAEPFAYDSSGNLIPVSKRFNVQTGDIRFSPRRTLVEKRAADIAAEERKYGVPSTTPNLATFDAEAIVKARNEIVREGTPTLAGKVADPELAERLLASQAVREQAGKEDALSRRVNQIARKRKEIQRRQAEIQAAVSEKEKSGKLGPVEFGTKAFREIFEKKELEDIMLPGSPTKLAPELKVTPEQLRQVFRNLDVEEYPTPQQAPVPVTDLISQKTPRSEITHRTILGKFQSDAAKAARIGDMKIDKALAAMSEKREAMFDAELARIENKFKTMELQGKAEEARQAGIDPEIVRRRQEHFANIRRRVAQIEEPAPLNSGPVEPPVETLLPSMATAADDPRIPRDYVIQEIRGKYKVWSIGRQAVQAVTDTYQEALKKAQAIQLKRRKKKNAA